MTQGERVKELRKTMGLTLEKFGNKLGVGKTAISKIEKGENNLTEQMTKAICREYNVNYAWLVDGVGEMFSDMPKTILDQVTREYDLDDLDRLIIEKYLQMPPEKREVAKEYIRSIVEAQKEKDEN